MFKLFKNTGYLHSYPIKKYSKFDYIRNKYKNDLSKLKSYYRYNNHKVNNDHILNRLITILEPSGELNIFDYLRYVESSAKYLAKQFNITSNIHNGGIQDNLIMGIGSKEILLYKESDIDIMDFENIWETLSPLRLIYSSNTDLNFRIPDKDSVYSDIPELNIITIDIVSLMMQYYYWKIKRIDAGFSTNPSIFATQIVLPNMLDNILDMAIWNRFINIYNGIENNTFTIKQPILLVDYSKGIDNELKKIVKDVDNVSMDIENILLQIPGLISKNMLDVLNTGVTYYTKQSEWVLWVSRLSIVSNILDLIGKRGKRKNSDIINILPVIIKSISRSTNIVKNDNIPEIASMDISIAIDNIKYKIGVR